MTEQQNVPLCEYGIFKTAGNAENQACASGNDGWSFADFGNDEVGIKCATMEPGCRTKWHIHSNGAHVIACVAGKALVQIKGQSAKTLNAGETMSVPAGVLHWHGAAKDSRAQILVIHACPQGLAHEFFEPVDDADYAAI